MQFAFEIGEACACFGTDGNDWGVFEKCAAHVVFDFEAREFGGVGIDEIAFCERDDSASYAEEAADFEMLTRLRLDRFIGGDDEEDEIESGGAGEHVADEAFVAGDVDEAEAEIIFFEKCETEIDGDAAALFFGEAIGMRAGEGFDERGFAVIDVAGGADDDAFGRRGHAESIMPRLSFGNCL